MSHRRTGASIILVVAIAQMSPRLVVSQGVEELAQILAAEDSRRWDAELLETGLKNPEPLVRRTAAMAIGRVGDWRGTELLFPVLLDPDTSVQTTAMFALGLLEDTLAVRPILERLRAVPAISQDPAVEGVAALAKIGGPEAAAFIASLLDGTSRAALENQDPLVAQALIDAWRLRDEAPVSALLNYVDHDKEDWRWRSVVSLSRLQAPEAGQLFLRALADKSPTVRAAVAGRLTKRYAARSGLDAETCMDLLANAVNDPNGRVRINALRALATFRHPETGPAIAVGLDDPVLNVRVQAAQALGRAGGPLAVTELTRVFTSGGDFFALKREALLGLSRSDSAAFTAVAATWGESGDWRLRAAAADGWGRVLPGPHPDKPAFLTDSDSRVVAAALGAWSRQVPDPTNDLIREARRLISNPDPVVRVAAAGVLGSVADPNDVSALGAMFQQAQSDAMPDAAWAALDALLMIADASAEGESKVLLRFLATTPRPSNYLVRSWAERNWPLALERWGPAYPIETQLSLQDYRAVAERFLVNLGEAYPHVFVETERDGTLEIELFGPDAPLTVQRFLSLVDRRFFDGMRWHRVVPDFVLQTGDPRGDGWGVAPGAVRDELNRRRYRTRYVGMALSGPDSGSSQWFITLSPQPRLDGAYTVFGRVVGASPGLTRLTQGDRIRTIRR
ncbi:MAG: HEAT repeat domain-containing protein [Gemmatimonadales bacterium]